MSEPFQAATTEDQGKGAIRYHAPALPKVALGSTLAVKVQESCAHAPAELASRRGHWLLRTGVTQVTEAG